MPLPDGIYEQIINSYINNKLRSQDFESKSIETNNIDKEESQTVLSEYLYHIIKNSLRFAKEKGANLEKQIEICNNIIQYLKTETNEDFLNQCAIEKDGEILLSIFDKLNYPSIGQKRIVRPETSIAQSSLFTGSGPEPNMVNELQLEIESSDRIDILVSFVKWSGIRLIKDQLTEFSKKGRLRVITTSYIGATDLKAVEFLASLDNTEVKISYDTKRTRLHAKAYTFYRDSGFSTSYIGSSNLSNSAITIGLEWNVKVTQKDAYDIIQKIEATFESYWNDPEFKTYTSKDAQYLQNALLSERGIRENQDIAIFDITPYDFQKEILDKLSAERKIHNNWKNLIVSATGTGKTVISAFDYKNFKKELKRVPRLLFVAHREEILKQSVSVFRGVLKDSNFGELLTGNFKPEKLGNLFISIQSFNSNNLPEYTPSDYYDMIIVDEFHHAAAPSYQKLLSYYNPKILLGLTATPERMDNLDILSYFNGKISAEIRLPEAIDRKLLSPFHYFGVSDSVDLDSISWKRGGYDRDELSKLYTGNKERVAQIIHAIDTYITDKNEIVGLGFCVSIEHANFMADSFNKAGISSASLHSNSPMDERNTIQRKLVSKEINFIFVVDLYNEGVDIPEVNTVLFLRPTESLTVFLQQFGRGLRLSEEKECLTVLDFVGRQNIHFKFEKRLLAITKKNKVSIKKQVEDDIFSLPKGCYIHLERVAREKVLENIKVQSNNRNHLIELAKSYEFETGEKISLAGFVSYHDIALDEIYSKTTFIEICSLAGLKDGLEQKENEFLKKSALKLTDIDSAELLKFSLELFENTEKYLLKVLSDYQKNMLTMLYYSFYNSPLNNYNKISDIFPEIFGSEKIKSEIIEILKLKYERIDFIDKPLDLDLKAPLFLHCSYTRNQIFSALGHFTLNETPSHGQREGVIYLKDKKLDVFFITLNKTEKQYSPSTMYEDYAINERLFHWQSQSTTSDKSPTGIRYINHESEKSNILLFVRESKSINNRAQPYICLGTARYVSHTGSRPMNIIWSLDEEIPAKFLKSARKMIDG